MRWPPGSSLPLSNVTRRDFLKLSIATSLTALLEVERSRAQEGAPNTNSIVVATAGKPVELVSAALEPLGGMGKFVGPGDTVLIKPNASFSIPPGRGANTSPEVASAVTKLAMEAGAERVILADHTINSPPLLTLQINGLKEASESCGGEFMILQKASDFEEIEIEGGSLLKAVDVAKIARECDVLINLPVMKHHDATGSSIGLKNLMGLVYDRAAFHRKGLDTCIAELSLGLRPDLTIVDATNVLMSNGPRGPGEMVQMQKVVAGTDPVAVDVACLELGSSLGYEDFEIGRRNRYVKLAADLGAGDGDPESVRSKTLEVKVGEGPKVCPTEEAEFEMPKWIPYASLFLLSLGLGLAGIIRDRRRVRDVRTGGEPEKG